LSFLASISLVISANRWFYRMAEEVNRLLPKEAQLDVIGTRWNTYRVLGLHGQIYPESPKRRQFWILCISGFALFFGGFLASISLSR
jgi:hypothetical protein